MEQAFLKVAQEESQELPATNTIESWLNEQEDVVRKPESIGSRSETASHVSCAHHCSCRKEIATLAAENQAIKFNQDGDAHGRYQRQCGFSADAVEPA